MISTTHLDFATRQRLFCDPEATREHLDAGTPLESAGRDGPGALVDAIPVERGEAAVPTGCLEAGKEEGGDWGTPRFG